MMSCNLISTWHKWNANDRFIWLGPRIVARDIWSSILIPVFITYRFTYSYISVNLIIVSYIENTAPGLLLRIC